MTRTSRAAVIPMPNQNLEVREYEIPELVAGSVLMKVANAGVCGTDVHVWHGQLAGVPYPLILGHEVVGTIEDIGPTPVFDLDGNTLAPGDRITFHDVTETCYSCWYCLIAKSPTKCPNRAVYGINRDSTQWPYLIGGYSEYMYLTPGTHIIKLPDHVSFDGASSVGCAMPTAIHTVERSPLRRGSHVVVQGAGPVGLMIAALAKLGGAVSITSLDLTSHRLEMARKFGATHTVNVSETTLSERLDVLQETSEGHGPDIVYEATGSAQAVAEGFQLVRNGGAYTICGQYTDSGSVEINPHQINKKHLDIKTVWGSETKHVYDAVKTLGQSSKMFPYELLVTHRFSLDDAQKALETQERRESVKAVISPHK
ncbi:MAG: alcohol dehydrogenase [Candidatus Thorarchaeota archaeon]|nr:alcohol dehydrogenase [Candidatus Thorarchaeota archaeon]